MGDFHPEKENSNVVNNMFAQINNSQRNKNKHLSTFSGVTKLISTKRNAHILQLFFAVFRHLPPKKNNARKPRGRPHSPPETLPADAVAATGSVTGGAAGAVDELLTLIMEGLASSHHLWLR